MAEVQSWQALYDLAKAAALLRTSKLTEESFSEGFLMDILAGLSATLGEEAQRVALEHHLKTFLATASGDDLDLLVSDHLGLARQAANAAIGEARFSRASAAAGNVAIIAGTEIQTVDGIRFITLGDVLMTGLQIDADIRAYEAGEAGNVALSTITQINDTLTDATVSVTNPEKTSGGQAAETDPALRQRALNYFRTIRRGTPLALSTGAQSIAGVATASVDESVYPPTVYIADVTGGASTALAVLVDTEMINWRSAGIQVNVVGATVVWQDVALTLTFQAGFDTSDVRDLVIQAVVTAVNATGIGETLYRSTIIAAAKGVEGIEDVVVSDPSGDVAPTASQLIRTETSRVVI